MLERNVSVFNRDVEQRGGYVYTTVDSWSARIATARQTDALVRVLEERFPRDVRIADIGCGDGTYTIALAERFRPKAIRGIDPAGTAIDAARRRLPSEFAQGVSFETGNIYDVEALPGEIAVVRGVLHHLDRAPEAIARLGNGFASVLILEPNGYNPVLKIIERASRYHREHDEKSYLPFMLDRWFGQNGYHAICRRYVGVVPYFCPELAARLLKRIEPAVEAIPAVKSVACGTNVTLYSRSRNL
jgi:SAM-dependent methyltransferase